MKKFLQCIILSVAIVSISFGIYKFSKGYDLNFNLIKILIGSNYK